METIIIGIKVSTLKGSIISLNIVNENANNLEIFAGGDIFIEQNFIYDNNLLKVIINRKC
jgi:hypothetical protein